ncbi:MAG: ABC transporter ATP-binding protein [Mycobacteriaceae bacterium]|nr:ABC transporter ATP-binding protein [Mycobacteriaceae bacterium]
MTDIHERPALSPTAFLDVRDLRIHFNTDDGLVRAVDGLSFSVERGKSLAIVGESGSGKSVTSLGILGLYNKRNARVSGQIYLDGQELVNASPDAVRALRGQKMSMIFQDPLSSLHPYYTIGWQIEEAYRVHNNVSKAEARNRAIELLRRVGIPQPDKRVDDYPHQFSGGMRQRAMIAMSLSCNPELLIADEPTTALDVTVQAQILDLMKDLQEEYNSAIILITHDLGVVAESCDDVVVMYGGQCVEQGSVEDVFYHADMPYTWGLLASVTRLDRERAERLQPIPGNPPSLINVPKGCVFNPRCAFQDHVSPSGERCHVERPDLVPGPDGHAARCHIDPKERALIWNDTIRPQL